MKKVIKLNNEISVDLPKLIEGGMVILANSGGGKSYLIRRIAEQAVPNVQVIIIDPEGEFASLREKYDFILAGKNADVPAEPRSAALLATKLLEINKSAVIDLYELHPQERQRFVKLFCDALVNAPKELYHPVLIILDEAHEYVPEGKPSEATWSVELLASKGRKRGQRLILASQRIAKISKNVTAEANNKLIGRASQDIDMKRAGDELGFNKENLKQLRQLKPGEFFAFGPAISDEVVKLKVGEVKTAHAKIGYTGVGKVPPASEAIKKILGELKDLPQEAEKEAKTVAELKKENTELKRQKQKVVHDMTVPTRMIEEAVRTALIQKNKEIAAERNEFIKHIHILMKTIETIGREVSKVLETTRTTPKGMKLTDSKIETKTKFTLVDYKPKQEEVQRIQKIREDFTEAALKKGELVVLQAIAQQPDGMTTEHIAVLTGYKETSRRTYLQRLQQRGFIGIVSGSYIATQAGIEALGDNFEPLPTGDALREHLMRILPEGEKKVLGILIEHHPEAVSNQDLEVLTNYKETSRRTYVQRLGARKLVVVDGGMVRASDKLFS